MKIVTADEMREIDRVTTERFGVPSLTLMENAGTAVAEFVRLRYPHAVRVGVICGKGNNGGDGFVVARKLRENGKCIEALVLCDPSELRGDAAAMFARIGITPTLVRSLAELQKQSALNFFKSEVLVDAILGTGFRPPVSELYAAAITALNSSGKPIVSIDIPSGANADAHGEQPESMVLAKAVVTFTAPKPAHVFGHIVDGPTSVCPIGSPDGAVTSSGNLNVTTARDVATLIGPRPADSNKGSFGHVLLVGGSLGKAGSVAMSAMAALRTGAGLATVATTKSALATVAGFHPELMSEPLLETESGTIDSGAFDEIIKLASGKSVVAIGPGISRHQETAKLVRRLVASFSTSMVLDADGLNAFDGKSDELNGAGKTLAITPHPGEMARLAACTIPEVQANRIELARNFAREHQLIVVLKGHRTLISHPDGDLWVNANGNPGMATGGTGDILTGMVAGMIAQNPKQVFSAVVAAVYLHGLAGDIACERMGEHSLVATDLLGALPEAFRRTRIAAETGVVEIHG